MHWTPAGFLCPGKNGEIGAVGGPDAPTATFGSPLGPPSSPNGGPSPVLLRSTSLPPAQSERSSRARRRPQPTDPPQDRREQRPRHRHLRQLERHHPRVMHDLRADLDQLLAQRRQAPMPYLTRKGHLPQEDP